jgi:hypothetical protein
MTKFKVEVEGSLTSTFITDDIEKAIALFRGAVVGLKIASDYETNVFISELNGEKQRVVFCRFSLKKSHA